MRVLLWGAFGLVVLALLGVGLVILFDAPQSPPAMESMATPFRRIDLHTLPAPRHFAARNGTLLQYYAYPGISAVVAVLIHGSGGPGTSMHAAAEALQAAGVTAYSLDVRGHGGSGRRGDIDYVGELENDLADFLVSLGPPKPGETRTLIGFSAGAGFAIRFAGGPQGELFDRYVFLSPILPGSPTLRAHAGGWTDIALPRLIIIDALERLGIHWFGGLPVIAYAVSPEMADRITARYSYRLAVNFGAGLDYATYLRNIRRPAVLLVGSADKQVMPEQFAPLLQRLGSDIPVRVLPGLGHSDMITAPAALAALVAAVASSPPTAGASTKPPAAPVR
jgi:pimeloyl-ACP methyl ester carboxylesterase